MTVIISPTNRRHFLSTMSPRHRTTNSRKYNATSVCGSVYVTYLISFGIAFVFLSILVWIVLSLLFGTFLPVPILPLLIHTTSPGPYGWNQNTVTINTNDLVIGFNHEMYNNTSSDIIKLSGDGSFIGASRTLRKRRIIPSFTEKGGVIVFFHIAETGGEIIRDYIQTFPRVTFERMYNPTTAEELEHKIITKLSSVPTEGNDHNTILFVEIHGDVPGFLYWQRKIHSYRVLAKYQSFFTFTLLREPVSFHTSYFNTYKLNPCEVLDSTGVSWCEPILYEPTPETEQSEREAVLLNSTIPNHQCMWLSRLSHNPYKQESCVTNEECRGTYLYMKDHLDWIGLAEQLDTVTIPLLTHILPPRGHDLGLNNSDRMYSMLYKQKKQQRVKIGQLNVPDLSNRTVQMLLSKSGGDVDLYNSIQKDYNIHSNLYVNYRPPRSVTTTTKVHNNHYNNVVEDNTVEEI